MKRKKKTLEMPTRLSKHFAKRVRAWRAEQGLPLKHVAADMGVSISVVSQWERAQRFPSLRNLEKIADYIGTRACCLLYDGKGECPAAKKPKARR